MVLVVLVTYDLNIPDGVIYLIFNLLCDFSWSIDVYDTVYLCFMHQDSMPINRNLLEARKRLINFISMQRRPKCRKTLH